MLPILLYKKSFLVVILCAMLFAIGLFIHFISNGSGNDDHQQKSSLLITFDNLVKKSNRFDKKTSFPTQANRISIVAGTDKIKQTEIEKQANNVHPLIHKRVMLLIKEFLEYKKQYGSAVEQKLYANMNELSFIDRLLIKRPLMFMTESDLYLLRNGKQGQGGFEAIGTLQEKSPLVLKDYLSYDEMQIAALVGVSVPTYFINNGNRYNKAILALPGTYQDSGVYVGLVGARFEKPGLMEWQHIIITSEQNTKDNGYGMKADNNSSNAKLLTIWASFYGTQFPTFDEAVADVSGRFIKLSPHMFFDTVIYKERMRMVLEPFLIDADQRGASQNKKVYCHAVGLGLGVWQKSPIQAKLMLDVYAAILKNRYLSHLSDLDFSWFPAEYQTINGIGHLGVLKIGQNAVTIHFSKRNPADKLVGTDAEKLLVAMYAWDGNAYPGNEYWAGNLTASGDPAAACCSTIPELQNPLINSNVSSNKLFITG